MKKLLLLTLILCYCFHFSYSQPGKLDATFGNQGIIKADFGAITNLYGEYPKQVLTQTDGTFYITLETNGQTLLTHLLANGKIDTTFGENGYSTSLGMIEATMALQKDGKIVILGSTLLARYNPNGTLDSTFSGDGKLNTIGGDFAIQSDGKIVIVGGFTPARYNTDGTVDSTFSTDGVQPVDFWFYGGTTVAIHEDGKIVVAGAGYNNDTGSTDFALVRYNTDGTPDSTFSEDGGQITNFKPDFDDYANSVIIQKDGKIVVVGFTGRSVFDYNDVAIARYNPDGSLDTSFSKDGKLTTDFENEKPATDYDKADDIMNAVTIQSNGQIVVAGSSRIGDYSVFAIARYNPDGSLDTSFSKDGKLTTDFEGSSYAQYVTLQSDGKIVLAGSAATRQGPAFARVRYNIDGTLDTTFSEDGRQRDYIKLQVSNSSYISKAVQNSDKIVVLSHNRFLTEYHTDNNSFTLARYHTDGRLDSTFSDDGFQTNRFPARFDFATSMAVQRDEKIIVVGSNARAGTISIIRYQPNGHLDSTFSEDGIQTISFPFAYSVALQKDGKIIVVGGGAKDFDDSETDFTLARFNTDGSLDSTFSGDGKQTTDFGWHDYAHAIAIQEDGKIIVAGNTLAVDVVAEAIVTEISLARYHPDGSLDKTFAEDGKQSLDFGTWYEAVSSVVLQVDGKILLAGSSGNLYDTSLREFALARYHTDGTLDTTFSKDGKQTTDFFGSKDYATSVVIQEDGKIVVAGNADLSPTSYDDVFAFARYNPDGTLDSNFGQRGQQTTDVTGGSDVINAILIIHNKLYALGTGQNPGDIGFITRYLLEEETKEPRVWLSTPYRIVEYSAPARIRLLATISDAESPIKKVEFYHGTTLVDTEYIYSYGFTWKNVPVGTYALTAKAIDKSGQVITSNTITVRVVEENVAPFVKLVSPVHQATYPAPATIELRARANSLKLVS